MLRSELVGLEVEVLQDSNPSNVKLRGKVVDETMKTLVIQSAGLKRIAKEHAVLKFSLDGVAVKVEGKYLIGRPEDRVKKQNKRKW
ncbi:MAG: ribonuclease P protein subunit [Candidatus Bathyarchaeia archaeon]